jgi:hypothetical protein
MRKDSGPARIKIAGDAGINAGHQFGHAPNQAWSIGAAPSTNGFINISGE